MRRVVLYGRWRGAPPGRAATSTSLSSRTHFTRPRIRAGGDILLARKEVDLWIETVTLHPNDFDRPFFLLAREIVRYGAEVEGRCLAHDVSL